MHVKKKKILLVEDDPIFSYRQATLLENNGYSVVRSSTGEKALRAFQDDPEIELILMDLDLGDGIDGAETARRILLQREVPINFLTAHREKEFVDRVKAVPNYGYILKNAGEYVLMNAIERGFIQFREKLERERRSRDFVDLYERIPVMTYCLDKNLKLLNANRLAHSYGCFADRPEGIPAKTAMGDLLGCCFRNDDPQGCGHGPECQCCALRELLAETVQNKEVYRKRTVHMQLQSGGTAAEVAFLASASSFPHNGDADPG